MEADLDFLDFLRAAKNLSTENRPLRMRLAFPDGISGDVLLPQRVVGSEAICGGLSYRIDCLATDATLELKRFIALPVELQFVTEQGGLRCVCGIVTEARAGQSDGGLATYQLTMSDAFALIERSCNSRVFRKMHGVEIIELIFKQ